MSRLDQLSQITDHVLDGLRADDSLKHRIYQKAAQSDISSSRRLSRRGTIIALSAVSAVMIAVFVLLGQISSSGPTTDNSAAVSRTADATDIVMIETVTAGEHRTSSPIPLQEVIDETVSQYDEEEEETADQLSNPVATESSGE